MPFVVGASPTRAFLLGLLLASCLAPAVLAQVAFLPALVDLLRDDGLVGDEFVEFLRQSVVSLLGQPGDFGVVDAVGGGHELSLRVCRRTSNVTSPHLIVRRPNAVDASPAALSDHQPQ